MNVFKEIKFESIRSVPFWLGDRIYKVQPVHDIQNAQLRLRQICPECGDKRVVTYRGQNGQEYEIKCPLCSSNTNSPCRNVDNDLTIYHYEVAEYIIRKAEIAGPETMSAYKDNASPCYSINSLTAFHRFGRSFDDIDTCTVPVVQCSKVDKNVNEIYNIDDPHSLAGWHIDYIYRDRKDAEKLLKRLVERDRKAVEEYNGKYGTNYSYPW